MYITNSATCKVRRWFGIKQSSERSRRGFTAAWARYNSLGEDCRDFITGQILLWSSDTTSMLINWNLFTLCYYSSHCLLMWIFFDQILGLYGLFLVVFLLYHRMDGEHSMALHLFFSVIAIYKPLLIKLIVTTKKFCSVVSCSLYLCHYSLSANLCHIKWCFCASSWFHTLARCQ